MKELETGPLNFAELCYESLYSSTVYSRVQSMISETFRNWISRSSSLGVGIIETAERRRQKGGLNGRKFWGSPCESQHGDSTEIVSRDEASKDFVF